MKKIIEIRESLCVGCSACNNICPVDAIHMGQDEYGFYKPVINLNLCIHCGACDRVCPVLNPQYQNSETNVCYAVWAEDNIRRESSSGGVFDILAKYMIEEGGYVFGAAWTDDLYVKASVAKTKGEVEPLKQSKYCQSYIGNAYRYVKECLKNSIPVLYVGTPCQIAALNNYLRDTDTSLLLTVDFICYYNPSIEDVRRYLDEEYGLDNIESFAFRDKTYGWISHATRLKLKGKESIASKELKSYFQGYFNALYATDACNNCLFSGTKRQADITMGDFWKIERHNPSWNDGKGTSMVWINNEKGMQLFSKVLDRFKRVEQVPMSWVREGQANAKKAHKNRDYFRMLLQNKSFSESVENALDDKFDIGFVCVQSYHNFGSALTNYAMYNVLCDLNYSVKFITQPMSSVNKPTVPGNFESNPYPKYSIEQFYQDTESMQELNKHCDAFLVGSDQLFNYEIYKLIDGFVKLDWVDDNHKKLSYAASFGQDKLLGPMDERDRLSDSLKRFDKFSVREESGVKLCESLGIVATHVLDPVFLCDVKHYIKLNNNASLIADVPEKYIFNYVLDPNEVKEKVIRQYESISNLESLSVSDRWRTTENIVSLWEKPTKVGLSNEQWISAIYNAEFVITDSYHGMCFAIIFNKPFVVMINKTRGAARFLSLLSLLNLNDNYDEDKEIIDCLNLKYDEVNKILEKEKEKSLEWLKIALSSSKEELSQSVILEEVEHIEDGKTLPRINVDETIKSKIGFLERCLLKLKKRG